MFNKKNLISIISQAQHISFFFLKEKKSCSKDALLIQLDCSLIVNFLKESAIVKKVSLQFKKRCISVHNRDKQRNCIFLEMFACLSVCPTFFYCCKILKMRKIMLLNPRTFFFVQKEDAHRATIKRRTRSLVLKK